MRLSRLGYYADFVVYPFLVLALSAVALSRTAPHAWIEWVGACVCGFAIWTLAEYIFHRFILHDFPFFGRLHDVHHADPTGYVGTPTWFSAAVIIRHEQRVAVQPDVEMLARSRRPRGLHERRLHRR